MTRNRRERLFRNNFREELEKIPGSFWESIQQVSIRGTADLIGCVGGQFVWLELKAERGKVSPLQDYKIGKVKAAGGFAAIVSPRNASEVLEALREL